MDAMDYDVHLFTDADSGEDAVVFRAQDSGHRGGSLLTSLAFFLVAACFWVCR
jgi:hypothetical protein